MPIAFRNHPPESGGMSTDWAKYATADECRERARFPEENAVIRMSAGLVRQIPGQTVQHAPLPENWAHAEVLGEKKSDPEVRVRFLMASEVVVSVGKL